MASYLWFYKVFKGFIKTKYMFRSSSFGIKYAYIWKKIVFIITKCIRILDMQHLCLIDIDLISNPKCFELQLDLIVRQYYGHFVCKLFLNLVCIITLFQVGQWMWQEDMSVLPPKLVRPRVFTNHLHLLPLTLRNSWLQWHRYSWSVRRHTCRRRLF